MSIEWPFFSRAAPIWKTPAGRIPVENSRVSFESLRYARMIFNTHSCYDSLQLFPYRYFRTWYGTYLRVSVLRKRRQCVPDTFLFPGHSEYNYMKRYIREKDQDLFSSVRTAGLTHDCIIKQVPLHVNLRRRDYSVSFNAVSVLQSAWPHNDSHGALQSINSTAVNLPVNVFRQVLVLPDTYDWTRIIYELFFLICRIIWKKQSKRQWMEPCGIGAWKGSIMV